MTPERKAKLAAIANLHDQWVTRNLPSAGENFDPSGYRGNTCYPSHHVDIDADPGAQDEFHAAATKILNGGR